MLEPDEGTRSAPLRRDGELVKVAGDSLGGKPVPSGFRRHLAGLELGFLCLGTALTLLLLGVPHRSLPREVPLPLVDRQQLAKLTEKDELLADYAAAHGLPFEVRAVGEALRRYGHASAEGAETAHALDDIRARARPIQDPPEPLLRLRAVQTRLFLSSLERWAQSGAADPELSELGGDFLARAREHGWLRGEHELRLDDAERRTAFRMRWNELLGLRDTFPFTPTLDEWRVYYRLLIRSGEPAHTRDSEATQALAYVAALAKKDPEYPADLARGVLFFAQGEHDLARAALRRHLLRSSSGRYALLARNYLVYALEDEPRDE